jgi:hypothetical protein
MPSPTIEAHRSVPGARPSGQQLALRRRQQRPAAGGEPLEQAALEEQEAEERPLLGDGQGGDAVLPRLDAERVGSEAELVGQLRGSAGPGVGLAEQRVSVADRSRLASGAAVEHVEEVAVVERRREPGVDGERQSGVVSERGHVARPLGEPGGEHVGARRRAAEQQRLVGERPGVGPRLVGDAVGEVVGEVVEQVAGNGLAVGEVGDVQRGMRRHGFLHEIWLSWGKRKTGAATGAWRR